MGIANKKKTQSLINAAAEQAEAIRAARDELVRLRGLFQSQSVDPAGTALAGRTAAFNAWITAVSAVADDPLVASLIAAKVPTHRGLALEVA